MYLYSCEYIRGKAVIKNDMRVPLSSVFESAHGVMGFSGFRDVPRPIAAPPLTGGALARPDGWERAPPPAKLLAQTAATASSIFFSGWLPSLLPVASTASASAEMPAIEPYSIDLCGLVAALVLVALAEGSSSGLLWLPAGTRREAVAAPESIGYDFFGGGPPEF